MSTGVQNISLDFIFQKNSQMVTRRIAGEMVLVPLRKNVGDLDNIYTLNETGAVVWNLLDGKRSLRGIVEELVREFEIEETEASRDVVELIAQLLQAGAVERLA